MKLKRFYKFVENKNYDVKSLLNSPEHRSTFFCLTEDFSNDDRKNFTNIFEKILNSDIITSEVRIEILEHFKSNDITTAILLQEGFFDSIKQGWQKAKDSAKELSSQAKNVLGQIVQKAKDAVDFVKKVKEYILDMFKKLVTSGVEKLKEKALENKVFTQKIEETAQANKEGLIKDLTTSKNVIDFYQKKMITKISKDVDENAIELAESEPDPKETGERATDVSTEPAKTIEVGKKYMYLNTKGENIEVVVVSDIDDDLAEVSSQNASALFKVKKDKLSDIAEESLIIYNDLPHLNESLLGSFVHKLEAIPPFSWLAQVKDAGEKGAKFVIGVLSEVTAKLGGPKFVLPVIASLLGVAFEQYIKTLAKGQLTDVAVYMTVPFMVPVLKFLGWVAMFIAAVIVIDDISNAGVISKEH